MRRGLLVLAVLLLLPGCGPDASPEQARRNQEILDGVADALRTEPGVSEATASYVDDASNLPKASVRVDCRGCDGPALVDAAVRGVWTSELTPLHAITVSVSDLQDVQTDTATFSVRTDEAELTEKYGERTVPSAPEEK